MQDRGGRGRSHPPLAPAVVSAEKWFVVSPATFVSDASAVRPFALTTAPDCTSAMFVTLATLTATPTPTVTPEPPDRTAEPSPFAPASVFVDVFSVSAPPALIVMPVGIHACEVEFEMLTPTAAARWNTTSARSTSSAVSDEFMIVAITYSNPGRPFRWTMLSIDPVDRSSITIT